MTHNQPCKFCRRPITVESDPDCDESWAARLVQMLACNRCADFRVKMGKLMRAAGYACARREQIIVAGKPDPDSDSAIRAGLDRITRGIAEAVCAYYHVRTIWEPDFVEQLFERPDKCGTIIGVYMRMVKRMTDQPRQTLADA